VLGDGAGRARQTVLSGQALPFILTAVAVWDNDLIPPKDLLAAAR